MAADEYEDDYRSELEDDDVAGQRSSPAPRNYVIEPELMQQIPRNVKVTGGTRFGRWVLIAMTLAVPSVIAYFGNESQRKWEALRDHGVEGTATLLSTQARKTGKNSHPPRGTYRYVVNGQPYNITNDFTDDEYRIARIGVNKLPIVYLPERPDVSRTRDNLRGGGTYAREAIALWSVASLLGVIFLCLWMYREKVRSRRLALAEQGIAVPTSTLDVMKASTKKNEANWKVVYSFEFDGRTLDGKGTYNAKIAQALLAKSNATVLVDPTNPDHNELYVAVQEAMTVLPSGGMSTFGADMNA